MKCLQQQNNNGIMTFWKVQMTDCNFNSRRGRSLYHFTRYMLIYASFIWSCLHITFTKIHNPLSYFTLIWNIRHSPHMFDLFIIITALHLILISNYYVKINWENDKGLQNFDNKIIKGCFLKTRSPRSRSRSWTTKSDLINLHIKIVARW